MMMDHIIDVMDMRHSEERFNEFDNDLLHKRAKAFWFRDLSPSPYAD